jgi:hypothetical protein
MNSPETKKDIFANECKNPLVWTLVAVAIISAMLPDFWGGIVATIFFFGSGLLCLFNFSRCKRYHCIITGVGFQVLGLLSLLDILGVLNISQSLLWSIFSGLLVVSYFLEFRHQTKHGSCYCR